MGSLFRGKMLAALEHASARGRIDLRAVDLQALRRKSWVVYAKRPFGGPQQVIRYLGRYNPPRRHLQSATRLDDGRRLTYAR
jgi:hypothetical protein